MLKVDHLRDWCTSGFSKHQCEQKLMKNDVHTAWNELFLLPAGIDKRFTSLCRLCALRVLHLSVRASGRESLFTNQRQICSCKLI
jgi:hypothetical protein